MLRILIIVLSIICIGCTEINENISPVISGYHVLGREEIKEDNKVIVFVNETLIIEGINLIDYNSVFINNYKCDVITAQSNAELITVRLPKNAITGKIRVDTSPTAVFSSEDIVVKKNAAIESFTPSQVVVGDNVVVKGNGFLGLLKIKIGDVSVSDINVISDTVVNFKAPVFTTSSKITFETKSGVFNSSTNIDILSPPTIEKIRPLVWTKDVVADVNGTNINTTSSVVLNNIPLLIIHKNSTDLRIQVSLDPNENYTSGNLVFINAAGSFTSKDVVVIIKSEVLVDIPNSKGTYFRFINNYKIEQFNTNNNYYSTSFDFGTITDGGKTLLKLSSMRTTEITATNKMSKWSIKLANNIPIGTVMFHEMKGATVDNYTLKIIMYNNNAFNLSVGIILLIKDPATGELIEFSGDNQILTSQNSIEQKELSYSFTNYVPVDSTITTSIETMQMNSIKGFNIVITPPADVTEDYNCYIEKITMTGPVYD